MDKERLKSSDFDKWKPKNRVISGTYEYLDSPYHIEDDRCKARECIAMDSTLKANEFIERLMKGAK